MKVSIIVPIYNVEKYLRRCLNSLIRQSYRDIEIICVNDGSTDVSGDICDYYRQQYEQIIVLHQENQGLAMARNNGVKVATGEYVMFVDADDYIADDGVEYLVNLMNSCDAQLAVTHGGPFVGDQYDGIQEYGTSILYNTTQALTAMCYAKPFGASAWGKLYKKEILQEHMYPEGKLYEDMFTTYKIIADCRNVIYGNKIVYYYFQREDSIVHMKYNVNVLDCMTAAKEQLNFIEKYFPTAVPAARYRLAHAITICAMKSVMGKEKFKEVFCYCRNTLTDIAWFVLRDKFANIFTKMKILIIMLGYNFSIVLFRIVDFVKKIVLGYH